MDAISTISDVQRLRYKVYLVIATILFMLVDLAFLVLVYSYLFEYAPKGSVPILRAFGWPTLLLSMAGSVLFRIVGENID